MKKTQRVLHIITRLDMGGSAQNTMETCLRLDRRRYQTYLVHGPSLESGMTAKEKAFVEKNIAAARDRGVAVLCLPSLVRRIDPICDFKALCSLFRLIRRIRPAIVHTHTSKAGLLGRLAARMARVPIVIHTPHGHVFYGHFGSLAATFFLQLEKLATRLTDCLVALTAQERNDYIRYGVSLPESTATIHSGVDIDRYAERGTQGNGQRTLLGLRPDDTVIGTVGWLLPIKGPMVLLKAFQQLKPGSVPLKLVYVGKGDMEAGLKAEAERMGLSEDVKFLGWRDDIPEIMPVFDIFVLASLNEGMGRVLVEAMAAEKPIVASAVGGIPDLVKNGENGVLVPPGEPDALTAALARLIENPAEGRRLGRGGRTLCQAYSIDAMVEKIEALYEDQLERKHAIFRSTVMGHSPS